jgi:anti-sigma regulatory factor (Ser/Thr protein kinase)
MSELEQSQVVQRLTADKDAPAAARAIAAEMFNSLRNGRDRADDLALVVSELVTNAVVHGPPGDLQLKVTGTRLMIRVEVSDDGTASFEWPADGIDGHWGLGLVSIFSDRSGVTRRPWTVVWCEFDLTSGAGSNGAGSNGASR